MKPRRSLRLAAVAVFAVVGLGACASTPSAKRVALDVVETLEVSAPVKQCMRDAIDNYSADDLQELAEAADGGDPTALQQFEASLRVCNNAG